MEFPQDSCENVPQSRSAASEKVPVYLFLSWDVVCEVMILSHSGLELCLTWVAPLRQVVCW